MEQSGASVGDWHVACLRPPNAGMSTGSPLLIPALGGQEIEQQFGRE
jgi:hypothetical protein